MMTRSKNYPNAFGRSKGSENLTNQELSYEPKDKVNKKLLFDILSESDTPLSRRELQKELNEKYKRYPELGTLCIPLIILERENKISWIKLNCSFTGNKCKHYFHFPYPLPLGCYWDWDIETQKLIIKGKAAGKEDECSISQI